MNKVLVALVAMAIGPVAMGDYLNPPPWTAPGFETYQGWEFDQDLLPTTVSNPYGLPTLTSDLGSETWLMDYEGRNGVMFFDGTADDWIYFDIPNADNGNPRKEIWMQIVYFAPGGFPGMDYWIEGWAGENTGFAGPGIGPMVVGSTPAGDWVYEAIHWFIEPNPMGETITLASSFWEEMYVDQIHIDTICFPEPGSLALLALGGVVLLRRR